MGRKPISEAGLVSFNVRVPGDIAEELEAEVEEEKAARPGRAYSKSDLVREILYAHVEERRQKRGGKKKGTRQ